nr:sigma-70 family RNA polymerase sigma factor [Stenotrophomonas maltophilia]
MADHYRQRQRRREEVLDDTQLQAIADPAPLPEQRLLDAEQLRHLDAIIAALPPRSRQVFLLARVEQLALAEIGRQLGISRQTAHGHLLRALVALQQVPGA